MNEEVRTGPFSKHVKEAKPESKGFWLGLEAWELVLIAISIFLIACIALPNYFSSLSMRRGQECTRRMLLVADCLKYLAAKNQAKPGEKICEALELNQALDLAQGALKIEGNMVYIPAFFRYGTEPDCSDGGDMVVNFYLDANGEIVAPTCSRFHEIGEDYCINYNMHICDISKVDGVITEAQEEVQSNHEDVQSDKEES
jgi:hypothetical protein